MSTRLVAALCAALALLFTVAVPAQAGQRLAEACTTNQTGTIAVQSAGGHAYAAGDDEYNSSAAEQSCTTGGTNLTVESSAINVPTDGAPGAYTSIFRGDIWEGESPTPRSGFPIPASDFTAASDPVHLSMTTTVPRASEGSYYDDDFDLFFVPCTGPLGGSGCTRPGPQTEIMLWLNSAGPISPGGQTLATDVKLGSHLFDVIAEWTSSGVALITYRFVHPVTSVKGLALGPFVADAEARGYLPAGDSLIYTAGGFEFYRYGAGASIGSFSVSDPYGS